MKTASLSIEADGEFVFRDLVGHEHEIDVKKTELVRVLGEDKALDFVADLLDKAMKQTLMMANLHCVRRKTDVEKKAAKEAAKEEERRRKEGPPVYVNRADREQRERAAAIMSRPPERK